VSDSLSHERAQEETVNSNMREAYRAGGRGRSSSGQHVGNRGRGSKNGKPKSHTRSSKTPEMKFVPHGIGKERQTVTYQTVKEYIIQLVQKTHKNGKDVANSLRKMEKINMT
jgi:hypothetical protein